MYPKYKQKKALGFCVVERMEITLSCASLLVAVACELDASVFGVAGVHGWICRCLAEGNFGREADLIFSPIEVVLRRGFEGCRCGYNGDFCGLRIYVL